MRCSASPTAPSSARTSGGGSPPSTGSRAPRPCAACSPTCRRPATTPSTSPAAAPSWWSSATRSCRASRPSAGRSEDEELAAAGPRGPGRAAEAPPAGRADRRLPGAAGARDRRHPVDGVLRLLPDRLRLHEVGGGARHPGRAGPRLGRGIAGRLVAADHRPRSHRATACCSSASSTPSGCRCRTSTSTSARSGARR